MKLWEGRMDGGNDELFDAINSSIAFDSRLVYADIKGSAVHAAMLGRTGIIPIEEATALIEELKKLGREDIMVIAGGVIPAQDYDFLYKAGVAAIFGPGTSVAKAAVEMMKILLDEE